MPPPRSTPSLFFRFFFTAARLEKRPLLLLPPLESSMRCVNRMPCTGVPAPARGRAARRVNQPAAVVVAASAAASSSSSSSSPDARSRGASAKAVASSSGRPAVDAPTSSPSCSLAGPRTTRWQPRPRPRRCRWVRKDWRKDERGSFFFRRQCCSLDWCGDVGSSLLF